MTPQEAAAELLARRRARDGGIAEWLAYMDLGYTPARHHELLIRELEALERGDCSNLIVIMPPGAAKSTYTSVVFASWWIDRHPSLNVVAASHTAELAERFGRRVRNIVGSDKFRAIRGNSLAPDSQAMGRWETTSGGEYYACGVGGSVTGRRADLVIIDDPVRSREDADSERIRDKTWDWYVSDLRTRLKPGAKQVLVMTRWHEDDLAGRLLEQEPESWRVVRLPMEAEEIDPLGRAVGERLWPEWFSDAMVATAKRDPRNWLSLYQGRPTAETGAFFSREWIQDYERLPSGLKTYLCSDFAVTEGGGDFTEHAVIGLDGIGNAYIVDWWRGQVSPDVWIDAACDLIQKHEPMCWFGESGPIRRSVAPFLTSRMRERGVLCRIEWLPSVTDKEARARGIQAMMSSGRVWWPANHKHKPSVVTQLMQFPAGKHDDAVDALSIFPRGLDLIGGLVKKQPKRSAPVVNHGSVWA